MPRSGTFYESGMGLLSMPIRKEREKTKKEKKKEPKKKRKKKKRERKELP